MLWVLGGTHRGVMPRVKEGVHPGQAQPVTKACLHAHARPTTRTKCYSKQVSELSFCDSRPG